MRDKVALFVRRFREAWISCLLCMVQGDISVVNWGHAVTASKTGTIAGIAFVLCSYFPSVKNSKTVIVWLIGLLTMCADILVHPTHFGEWWTEAVVTGLGASAICWIMVTFVDEKK